MNNNVIRCMILGDINVGKTYLFNILSGKSTQQSYYDPSIGVDVSLIKITSSNNVKINMLLYDCSGDNIFTNIIETYLFDIDIFLLVYNDNKVISIEWIKYLLENKFKKYKIHKKFLVLINNTDLTPNPYKTIPDKIINLIYKYCPIYIETDFKKLNKRSMLECIQGPIDTIALNRRFKNNNNRNYIHEIDINCCF